MIAADALPQAPEAVTPEWLTEALTRGGVLGRGERVVGCTVQPLGAGGGLMALVSRIALEYAGAPDDAPRTLIAKFPSPSQDNRAVAETYDMYGREVRFYQTLAATTELPHPACYFAARSGSGSGFVLLLEDLGDRRAGDQVIGSDLAEAEIVVDALAAFHAQHFGARVGDVADWITTHANATQVAGHAGGFAFGWPRFVDLFADVLPPGVRRWGERVGPATGAILERLCGGPLVLTHADCRLENMFFAARPGQPDFAIVDWQSVTWSAPGQDLAYYLTQSVQLDVRRRHERVLLDRYLDGLRRHGVRDYGPDRLLEDYRRATLYLLDYAVVIAATLDLSNARGAAIARALATRACAALEDLDCEALLPD